MRTLAWIATGKGTGAIGSVAVYGPQSSAVVGAIFRTGGKAEYDFTPGRILHGEIVRDGEIIDDVVIGCESNDKLLIHCHGNPLILQAVMRLLEEKGAKCIETRQGLLIDAGADSKSSTIEKECILAQAQAVTLTGAKAVEFQRTEAGLKGAVKRRISDSENVELIHKEVHNILAAGRVLERLVYGCRVVLAGPPNVGKSTLLNRLCGQERAIVSDIPGTTRDWVSGRIRKGDLFAEVIDTAGLDEAVISNEVDKESQQRARKLIEQADLILYVIEAQHLSAGPSEYEAFYARLDPQQAVLQVANKIDRCENNSISAGATCLPVSAKTGEGLPALIERMENVLGMADYHWKQPACFTARQRDILTEIVGKKTPAEIAPLIAKILDDPLFSAENADSEDRTLL